MRKIKWFLLAFGVTSCGEPGPPAHLAWVGESGDGNIREYFDAEHSVRCYMTYRGVYCVVVPSTKVSP